MNPHDPDRRVNLPAAIVATVWAAALFCASLWIMERVFFYGLPALYTVLTFDGLIEAAR